MSSQSPKQQLESLLPHNMIATRKWLSSRGMSRHAIDNTLKSNKIKPLAVGVYTRPDSPSSWQSVVCSLQLMTDCPIYIGGLSALQQLGLAQYLTGTHIKTVHLYAEKNCLHG